MINGVPAATITLQVVPAGTYGPADKQFPQRNVPSGTRAWRVSADISNRPVGVSVYVYLEMSWDNGATWVRDEARIEETDGVVNGSISMAVGLGALNGGTPIPPEKNGVVRLARGGAVIGGGSLTTTGLVLELWN